MLLKEFEKIRPPFESDQEDILEWLVDAHTESEKTKGSSNLDAFRDMVKEKLWKVGCKPDAIGKRGHILLDPKHRDWQKMKIYRLSESPNGADLSLRSEQFAAYVDGIFEEYYPHEALPPDDLIHVSCTGYVSPSGGQKIASKRSWGDRTTVTHAYHMGCYASVPAIRMAMGFLAASPEKKKVDVVHTEICSLHSNPANHNLDQLVSQSLFADGCIKYSVCNETQSPHLRIKAILEEIIPDSIEAMSWNVMHWGFEMSLAKEVPVLIARSLEAFVKKLALRAKQDNVALLQNALFAVHPGGPKIIAHVKKILQLSDDQIIYSSEILKKYGNMSSATLPHIWSEILVDSQVPDKTPIVSLAFGPGLSIVGAVLEKSCGG